MSIYSPEPLMVILSFEWWWKLWTTQVSVDDVDFARKCWLTRLSSKASLVPLEVTVRIVCTVPVSFGERSPELGSVLVLGLSGTWISTEIRSEESESSRGSGTITTAPESRNSPCPPTTKHKNRVYLSAKIQNWSF